MCIHFLATSKELQKERGIVECCTCKRHLDICASIYVEGTTLRCYEEGVLTILPVEDFFCDYRCLLAYLEAEGDV